MTKKTYRNQQGSLQVVSLIVATLIIVAGMTYVFISNLRGDSIDNSMPAESQAESPVDSVKQIEYRKYETDIYPMSFKYPENWTLENASVDDTYGYMRSIDVRTHADEVVQLSTGTSGLGGLCESEELITGTTIDVTEAPFKAPNQVVFSATVTPGGAGGYDMAYGLTDRYTELKDYVTCHRTYYYLFETGSPNFMFTAFEGEKHFSDKESAYDFISTEEYVSIKQMILSLRY